MKFFNPIENPAIIWYYGAVFAFAVLAGVTTRIFIKHPVEEGHLIETPTENITIESAATVISNLMKQARDCKLGEAKGNLYITSFETDEQIILDCATLIKGYGKLFDTEDSGNISGLRK